MSTFSNSAILAKVSTVGWTELEHHLDTVAGSFPNCIYNHRTTKTNQKYPSVNL